VELEPVCAGNHLGIGRPRWEWLLVPRREPWSAGLNWDSLERLYSIEGVKQFPALLHLIPTGQS